MDSQENYLFGVVPDANPTNRNNIIKVKIKYTADASNI